MNKITLSLFSSLYLIGFVFLSNVLGDDVILPPPQRGAEESALLLVPAEGVSAEAYVGLAKSIQSSLSQQYSLSFWIGIPDDINLHDPTVKNGDDDEWQKVKDAAERIKGKLFNGGFQGNKLFYSAHSRSGALLQEYLVQDSTVRAAGMVLLGSFLSRGNLQNQSPTPVLPPTLVLSGSLDGVARVTRLAENFYNIYENQMYTPNQNYSVIVVEGMSHCQYFDGPAPQLLQENDLTPEINTSAAREEVSKSISDWIFTLHFSQARDHSNNKQVAMRDLKRRLQTTKEFLAPIISSLKMEGFYFFESPCYIEDKPNCTNSSPWLASIAQAVLGGASLQQEEMKQNHSKKATATVISDFSTEDKKKRKENGFQLQNSDLLWPVDRLFPHDYLPKVYNKCPSPDSCVLQSMTVTELRYVDVDKYDMGLTPSSAYEMACKLNSRQRIFVAAGMGSYLLNQTDDLPLCSLVNSAALNVAAKMVSPDALNRYLKYGKKMLIGKDYSTVIYPLWSPWHLCVEPMTNGSSPSCPMPGPFDSFKTKTHKKHGNKKEINILLDDVDHLLVESPSMYFSTNLPIFGGLHFCKLLSPARVVEWIYVDSLRQKQSTKKL